MKKKLVVLLVLVAVLVAFAACANKGNVDITPAKNGKKAQLNTYNQADYYDAEWTLITNARNKAVADIDAMTTLEEINAYDVKAVNDYMDSVLTKTDYAEIAAAKEAIIASIVKGEESDYYPEEWAEIEKLYSDAVSAINALTTLAEVQAYDVGTVNDAIAEILTKDEKDIALLNAAKKETIASIVKGSEDNYYSEQWTEVCAIYDKAVEEINALKTLEEVQAYDVQAVNDAIAEVLTKSQVDALKPTITTTLEDGMTYGTKKITFDVFAKDKDGNKIASSVTNNGEKVDVNWDDSEKTSFTMTFTEYENNIVITATDGKYTTELTLKIYYVKSPATFTFSMDAFGIGCGYIVEPTLITLDDETVKKIEEYFGYDEGHLEDNLRASHVLIYELSLYDITVQYTGQIESSFYMASIKGFYHENNIPDNLLAVLEENGFSVDDSEPMDNNCLGEFDYTYGSGWMYEVNGVYPNVGFADYYIQNNDVMRVSFTLAYGGDLANSFFGPGYFTNVCKEKDGLCNAIALANKAGKTGSEAYSKAMEVIATYGLEPAVITAAEKALRDTLGA